MLEIHMPDVTLIAADISCEHCKKTIEEGLTGQPGVSSVTVDIPAKVVRVTYDESATSEAAIRSELDELGYPVAQPA
jgi:copper chaperone CopZ